MVHDMPNTLGLSVEPCNANLALSMRRISTFLSNSVIEHYQPQNLFYSRQPGRPKEEI